MDIRLIFLNYCIGVVRGRMRNIYTLTGLGGDHGFRVEKVSAKKSRSSEEDMVPVPETDTGRVVEYTEGREITLSKELGKMAP